MRINRIRSKNFFGLGDFDWIFPLGPVLLAFKDKGHLKLVSNLLLTLFYDQREISLLANRAHQALVEVWISSEDFSYHICHQFIKKDNQLERLSTVEDETGQPVSLPETMTIGDYLLKVQLQAFLQGGLVEWPENDAHDHLIRRIQNLRQGGDEGLSLSKVRASINGAQKRVKDRKESMELVKAEYDTLRREWETAHRRQDEERSLQIELINLQEKEVILTEKIASTTNLQKRIELLAQNPDYREVRQLQDEINRLEEKVQNIQASLKVIFAETSLDWAVLEDLREDCLEWAYFQKNLSFIETEVEARSKKIGETQNLLQVSRYAGLSENGAQQLRRAEEERADAQEKINRLPFTKRGLDKLIYLSLRESAHLESLAFMADVTEFDKIWLAQKEKYIELWRDSKVGSILDQTLRKRLGVTSIVNKLSSRLLEYYQRYHVTNYQEFMSQLKEFLEQKKRIEKMKRQIERLQDKVSQENELRRIVCSREEIIKQALTTVQAADYREWLNGWEDFQREKRQLSSDLDQLRLDLEEQSTIEKDLAACAELLRGKLINWGNPVTDREEAFAAVLKVAGQLQEREEAEREIEEFREKLNRLLGDRNMEQLSKALEPLAELEREKLLSNEERLAELAAWDKELAQIRLHLTALKRGLQSNRDLPSLSVLEKRIEVVKRRWLAYEDLCNALDDAQNLLELSWQEWQTKHEKTLGQEKKWICDHCFSEKSAEGETVAKRDYFSYRMAVAQLALRDNTELPLFFSVGNIRNEDQIVWEEIIDYLQKLSLSRQVIFCTCDSKLSEKLSRRGWSHKVDNNGRIIENNRGSTQINYY